MSSLEGKCLRFGSRNYSNTWFCVSVHLPALPHVLHWSRTLHLCGLPSQADDGEAEQEENSMRKRDM